MGKTFKDPVSGFTHLGGAVAALIGTAVLAVKASSVPDGAVLRLAAFTLFGLSLILLYTASTLYHLLKVPDDVNRALRKLDHSMIFVLIAGTYTPISLISMSGTLKWIYIIGIWTLAALGVVFKMFFIRAPRWVSAVLYVLMGWSAVFGFVPLYRVLGLTGLLWLLAGGIFYSAGAVFYAVKWPNFSKSFGFHEFFHIFVLLGSICHYWLIFRYV